MSAPDAPSAGIARLYGVLSYPGDAGRLEAHVLPHGPTAVGVLLDGGVVAAASGAHAYLDVRVPAEGAVVRLSWAVGPLRRLGQRWARLTPGLHDVAALTDVSPASGRQVTPGPGPQPPTPPPSGDVAAQVAAARAAAEGARASADAAARDLAAVRADVAAGRIKGDPGADAREPEITASASSVAYDQPASVMRTGTYPTLGLMFSIPQGRPGRDGDPGQPGQPGAKGYDAREPIFTATATALGEDAQPTALVTGTYPALTLELGIPRGKPGPPGPPSTSGSGGGSHPLLLSGPGRPDVPPTTGGVITGSEAVGTEYRSTDGAGVGAWVWMRRPTGWVVVDGDTGWRNIGSGYLPAEAEAEVFIRRVNERVCLHVKNIVFQGKWPGPHDNIPGSECFAPRDSVYINFGVRSGGLVPRDGLQLRVQPVWSSSYSARVALALVMYYPNTTKKLSSEEVSWTSAITSWPTTLPGLPV